MSYLSFLRNNLSVYVMFPLKNGYIVKEPNKISSQFRGIDNFLRYQI